MLRGGQIILVVVAVASVSFGAHAARVKHQKGIKLQAEVAKAAAYPPFKSGAMFVCMPKWLKGKGLHMNPFSDNGLIVNAHCLVNMKEIQESMPRFPYETMDRCVAKSSPHTMKLCGLKGKKDKRLHYSGRVYVPKSCMFPVTDPGFKDVPFMVAKYGAITCEGLAKTQSSAEQGLSAIAWPVPDEPALLWEDPVVDEVRTELTRIYKEHNPDKLADVEKILVSWSGQEKELLAAAKAKYQAPPAALEDPGKPFRDKFDEVAASIASGETTFPDNDDDEEALDDEEMELDFDQDDEIDDSARELTAEELASVKVQKAGLPSFEVTMNRWKQIADGQNK